MKGPHHQGTYDVRSRALVAAAKADPSTRCARCGRTLDQHPPTKKGRPPKWSAGHVIDGQVDGPMRPEVLSCNSRAGARLGRRTQPEPELVTDLTWVL